MAIKHVAVKASGQKGYAVEWNANHVIDSDVDFQKHQSDNHVIENRTDFSPAPVEGQIIYRTDEDKLYTYDGAAWVTHLSNPSNEILDMNTHKIIGVVDPTTNQEAATKKYVDDEVAKVTPIADSGQQEVASQNFVGSWTDLTAGGVTVTVAAGQKVLITWSFIIWDNEGKDMAFRVRRSGSEIDKLTYECPEAQADNIARSFIDTPGSGDFTYILYGVNDVDETAITARDIIISVLVFG